MTSTPLTRLICLILLLTCGVTVHAQTCEALHSQIDAKIKASGVTQFTLLIVNTTDTAPGKVVGTCAQGAKKIVYARTDSAAAAPATAAATPKGMLTECKDGSVTYRECKK